MPGTFPGRDGQVPTRLASDSGGWIWSTSPAPVPGDLVITNDATTPNSKAAVTAGRLVLAGATDAVEVANVSIVVDIAAVGANGLDAGIEAANTWYYVWIIWNPSGAGTVAGLLSTSAAAPTMPSGYTYKRRVGAIRNDGSSNFLRSEQRGTTVLYTEVSTETQALSAGQAITFTDVSLAAFVPPVSRRAYVVLGVAVNHGTAGVNFDTFLLTKGAPGTTDGVNALMLRSIVANVSVAASNSLWIGTDASQVVQYKITTAPSAAGGANIDVLGYEDPI